MKTLKNIFAAVILITFAAVNVNAQVTATAGSEATIITPIAITKTVDLNFGNIAVQPNNGGTVVLAPDGSRTSTAGVTLPVSSGTVSAASFNVTGDGNRTFSITLPTSAITLTSGSNNMTMDTFTSTPSGTGTLAGGSQTVTVGATLIVNSGQTAGLYTNEDGLFVTVNYN